MSNRIGQPAQHTQRVATSKGVLITAGVAVVAVGVAFAVGTAFSAFGAPLQASLASSSSSTATGTPVLSAAGLDALLETRFSPVGAAVTQLGSPAAQQVTSLLNTGSGTLSSTGAVLTVGVPAIANIAPAVQAALAPIGSQMSALSGSTGQVAHAVNNSVASISPLLNLSGSNANVTANVPINLNAAVAPDLSDMTEAGAVTIDPQAGTASIDLSKLLANQGTSTLSGSGTTLSPAANAQITADMKAALAALGSKLVSSATNSVENTPVNVHGHVHVNLRQQAPFAGASSTCNGNSSTTPSGSSATTTTGGLLGGFGNTVTDLLGDTIGTTGTGTGTVEGLLCSLPTKLLPSLLTTLSLKLEGGNVGQVIEGTAPPASGSISVSGQPAPFPAGGISHGVGQALVNNFVGTTSTGGAAGSDTGTSGNGTGNCASGSATLTLCLRIGGNLSDGIGDPLGGTGLGGLNLGGLGAGNLLDSKSVGTNQGILGSLLNDGGGLRAGISASVGTAGANVSNGADSSGSGNLLKINAGTNGNGLNATEDSDKHGATTSSTGSGKLIGIQVGTPSTDDTNSGNGILNLGVPLGH